MDNKVTEDSRKLISAIMAKVPDARYVSMRHEVMNLPKIVARLKLRSEGAGPEVMHIRLHPTHHFDIVSEDIAYDKVVDEMLKELGPLDTTIQNNCIIFLRLTDRHEGFYALSFGHTYEVLPDGD